MPRFTIFINIKFENDNFSILYFQRTLPMRHKQIIGLNVHGSVKFAVDFALSIVSEKMRNRIKFYTNAELANNVDISLLPKEVKIKNLFTVH